MSSLFAVSGADRTLVTLPRDVNDWADSLPEPLDLQAKPRSDCAELSFNQDQ